MPSQKSFARDFSAPSEPTEQLESPFLDGELFADVTARDAAEWASPLSGSQLESPFQSAFESEQESLLNLEVDESEADLYDEYEEVDEYEFDDKLYDREFDQGLEDRSLVETPADGDDEEQLEATDYPVLRFQRDQFELEIIGEKDNRKYINNTLDVPFRWICSLELYTENPEYPQGPKWLLRGNATGVLIRPSCVLTAAHSLQVTVDGKQRPVERIVVTPGRNGDKAPFGRIETWPDDWRTPNDWDPNKEAPRMWDFAVIRLNEALGNKTFNALNGKRLGWWGSTEHGRGTSIKPLKADWLRNRVVRSAGYPGDRCGRRVLTSVGQIRLCAHRTPEVWASTQWYARGRVREVDVKHARGLLRHTIDMTRGQSGSPIWYYYGDRNSGQERWWLVGLHVAPGTIEIDERGQSRPIDNLAIWIRQEVLDTIADLEVQLLRAGRGVREVASVPSNGETAGLEPAFDEKEGNDEYAFEEAGAYGKTLPTESFGELQDVESLAVEELFEETYAEGAEFWFVERKTEEFPKVEAHFAEEEPLTLEEAEFAFQSEDEEYEEPLLEQELRVVKVWRRPPFPRGLKAGILARGVARVPTKNLLGWFIRTHRPNIWLRRLDADLIEVAPEVTVTIEVFRKLKPKLSGEELIASTKGYLEIRHNTDLKATPFWSAHAYSLTSTTLPERLGVNLEKLLTASHVKGIPPRDTDKFFLVFYASFPSEIERWMVREEKAVLDRFGVNEDVLTNRHLTEIERIARLVDERESSRQPIRTFRLIGHTDPVGKRSYNINLGLRRALAVKDALIKAINDKKAGLPAKISFIVKSRGEEAPVADNKTEDGRAQNRRVEIYLSRLGKGPALTGRLQRVPIESVVERGLRLLKNPRQAGVQLSDEETKRMSCFLRKVLSPDVDDRFVDSTLAINVYNKGQPQPEFAYLKDWLTLKHRFGPTVDDSKFLKELEDQDRRIIEGMGTINRLSRKTAPYHGILQVRTWMLDRIKRDVSIYNCYREFVDI